MSTNDIGQTIYMAEGHPATNDPSGFEAMTWVEVSGPQSIGERGVSHNGIDVQDLKTGFTFQVKGEASGVDTTLVFRKVDADTGQGNMKTQAEDRTGEVSIKIATGSGAANALTTGDPVEYAQGIIHSYRPRESTVTSHKGFSTVFRNNDFWVVATEPAA